MKNLKKIEDIAVFDSNGLMPVIVQDNSSKEVLMLAWMNREALEKTIEEWQIYYWSRSRNALWKKGETSGQTQQLISLTLDCDNDAILVIVEQKGVACHTGRKSCFFKKIEKVGQSGYNLIEISKPLIDPKILYDENI